VKICCCCTAGSAESPKETKNEKPSESDEKKDDRIRSCDRVALEALKEQQNKKKSKTVVKCTIL
jgi:hypothetical protein